MKKRTIEMTEKEISKMSRDELEVEVDTLRKSLETARRANRHERAGMYNADQFRIRCEILRCMNTLVRNINDESFIDDWLSVGVPDGGTEEDIKDMAASDDLYLGAVRSFLRTMRRSDDPDDYFAFSRWGYDDDWYGSRHRSKLDVYEREMKTEEKE